MTDHINTEGVMAAGEVDTRLLRTASVEENYRNSFVAGQVSALEAMSAWVSDAATRAGAYDDIRPLRELQVWIADQIRQVQNG